MNKRLIVLVTFALSLIVGGIIAAFAFSSRVVVVEAAAPIAEVAALVVQEPVRTVCRSNDSLMELCISSDGRGLFTVNNGVALERYVYAFYDAPGGCPTAMAGYQVRVSDWSVRELEFFGFNAADFSSLNVNPYYCTFAPVS
jgi:hypothetical protein